MIYATHLSYKRLRVDFKQHHLHQLTAHTEEQLHQFPTAITIFGLKINPKKMAISEKNVHSEYQTGNKQLEQVKVFVCLSAVITKEGSCDKHIQNKISNASATVGKFGGISKDLSPTKYKQNTE